MDKDKIKIFESNANLAAGFAEILCKRINVLLARKEMINIALSGGNTPIDLFKVLSENYKDKIDWNSINIYWVDERCVPKNSPESNFGNADKYLFSKLEIEYNNIHRINGEVDPEKEAKRYSELVMRNIQKNGLLPSFDIILLGIGDDGHTASIFPNQMELLTSEKIYDVSIHPVTNQKRITMTGPLINNAVYIYFLVSGKSKAKIINDILNDTENAKYYPAFYIKPHNGEVFWIVEKSLMI